MLVKEGESPILEEKLLFSADLGAPFGRYLAPPQDDLKLLCLLSWKAASRRECALIFREETRKRGVTALASWSGC